MGAREDGAWMELVGAWLEAPRDAPVVDLRPLCRGADGRGMSVSTTPNQRLLRMWSAPPVAPLHGGELATNVSYFALGPNLL